MNYNEQVKNAAMSSYVQPCFFYPHYIVDKTFDELKNAFDAFLQQQSKKLINHCMITIHLVFKCSLHMAMHYSIY